MVNWPYVASKRSLRPVVSMLGKLVRQRGIHIRVGISTIIFVSRALRRIEPGFTAMLVGAEKNHVPRGTSKDVEMLCFEGPS